MTFGTATPGGTSIFGASTTANPSFTFGNTPATTTSSGAPGTTGLSFGGLGGSVAPTTSGPMTTFGGTTTFGFGNSNVQTNPANNMTAFGTGNTTAPSFATPANVPTTNSFSFGSTPAPSSSTFGANMTQTTMPFGTATSFGKPGTGGNLFSFGASSTPATQQPSAFPSMPTFGQGLTNVTQQQAPQIATLPDIPRNMKYVDVPSHIKDALGELEKRIKQVSHQAASPTYRPDAENDATRFLVSELGNLSEKMDSYNVSLDCSKKLLEEYKAKEDEQFSAAELALNTYERLNQPHLRNGLAALDPSIFSYFRSVVADMEDQYAWFIKRLNELQDLVSSSPIRVPQESKNDQELEATLRTQYSYLLLLAGRIATLQKNIARLKSDYVSPRS